MYVADYKKNYVVSLDQFVIRKGEEGYKLEDGSKEIDFCIYAECEYRKICLYRNFKEGNRDYEFDEFIKALQGSRNFFQFGKATNWDGKEE